MSVVSLIDTNILVYRYDPRYPEKQQRATKLLREGILEGNLRLPHQSLIEFLAAVTRQSKSGTSLLSKTEAIRETEELLLQFSILYPTEAIVRTALRGMATYQLSWFDAHIWAYAECYGLPQILSEDFQHGRRYGTVRILNPFLPS